MNEPDWIVLRFSSQVPVDQVPLELEGHWFDRSTLEGRVECTRKVLATTATAAPITRHSVARPTGRFEVDNERMIVAEVWEVDLWE